MTRNSIRIETVYRPDIMATDLYVLTEGFRPLPDGYEETDPGALFIAKPMEFEKTSRNGVKHGPTLRLDRDTAREFMQSMMDAAWSMGLRPSGVKDLESTLEATRFHLEDMRLLAKVRKPE